MPSCGLTDKVFWGNLMEKDARAAGPGESNKNDTEGARGWREGLRHNHDTETLVRRE